MDVYNERRLVAEKLRKVYIQLYNAMTNKGIFYPDLEEVSSETILDFGLFTSGFIGINNNTDIASVLSSEEIQDMFNGNFYIDTFSQQDAETLMQEYEVDTSATTCPKKAILLKVQDGEYYLERDKYLSSKNYTYKLMLKTDPISLDCDKYINDLKKQPTPFDYLTVIRNTFVHTSPLIDGRFVLFISSNSDTKITATKMWLRGFCESFCRLDRSHNTYALYNYISAICDKSENTIENEEDLRTLIYHIQTAFPEESRENLNRIQDYLATRVKYCAFDFYALPIEDKIDALTEIIANNSSYINKNKGQLNTNIVYAIQQKVAKNMEERDVFSSVSLRDLGLERIMDIINREVKLNEEYDALRTLVNSGKFNPTIVKTKQARLQKEEREILNAKLQIKRELDLKKKLESSNLTLLGGLDTDIFAPEYAVAVVSLLAYNSLITSCFYDELKADVDDFSPERKALYDSIQTPNVYFHSYTSGKHAFIDNSPQQKYWFFAAVRQALCHNGITYKLPEGYSYRDCSIYDIKVYFTNEHAGTSYNTTVKDLFKIFSNPAFTNERDPKIKSNKFELDHEFNSPEMEALEKTILEHPLTFIRRIEQGDQE